MKQSADRFAFSDATVYYALLSGLSQTGECRKLIAAACIWTSLPCICASQLMSNAMTMSNRNGYRLA
jgi:hypothetical protein